MTRALGLKVIFRLVTKISADLFAGAIFITEATKTQSELGIYIAILILLAIACVFTVAGGLSAVIWTDFVQTILMIIGAFVLCARGMNEGNLTFQPSHHFFKQLFRRHQGMKA